jgi:hypothetical protein
MSHRRLRTLRTHPNEPFLTMEKHLETMEEVPTKSLRDLSKAQVSETVTRRGLQ